MMTIVVAVVGMAWRVTRVRYSTGKAQTSNAYEFVRLVPNIVGQRTARTLDWFE